MKAPKGLIAIFFGIFILLTIGVLILNDDSSLMTVKQMWAAIALLVLIVTGINYIRKKRGSE